MIVASPDNLQPGQCRNQLSDSDGVSHSQPFIVLRPATADEWYKDAVNSGMQLVLADYWRAVYISESLKFYEVSLD